MIIINIYKIRVLNRYCYLAYITIIYYGHIILNKLQKNMERGF
nr:MAG TPA: hypothetical protein [Caudoviricetes sp.]